VRAESNSEGGLRHAIAAKNEGNQAISAPSGRSANLCDRFVKGRPGVENTVSGATSSKENVPGEMFKVQTEIVRDYLLNPTS
jgi:hypothetical protein